VDHGPPKILVAFVSGNNWPVFSLVVALLKLVKKQAYVTLTALCGF